MTIFWSKRKRGTHKQKVGVGGYVMGVNIRTFPFLKSWIKPCTHTHTHQCSRNMSKIGGAHDTNCSLSFRFFGGYAPLYFWSTYERDASFLPALNSKYHFVHIIGGAAPLPCAHAQDYYLLHSFLTATSFYLATYASATYSWRLAGVAT